MTVVGSLGADVSSVTSKVAVPTNSPAEAEISVVPSESLLVSPEESTVATPASELPQLAVPVKSAVLPSS